jgi:enoyl-CoA hydratase/carnithine racemase
LYGQNSLVRLNREHRNNILTSNFSQNIVRILSTMEADDQVRVITLMTENHQNFSLGTDFRSFIYE